MNSAENFQPTEELCSRIISLLSHGLVAGLGTPEPGKMCVEAAVCAAMNLPHSDSPACIGDAVRSFQIRLNDSSWSSEQERAKGLKRLAIAQLGSDKISQEEFSKKVWVQFKTEFEHPRQFKDKPNYHFAYTYGEATIADIKRTIADTVTASAADYKDTTATFVAATFAFAGKHVADSIDHYASAAAAVYAYGNAAAPDEKAFRTKRDEILSQAAEIAVQVLIELKSPGCEFLWMCEQEGG
jgi:hypothetical protein